MGDYYSSTGKMISQNWQQIFLDRKTDIIILRLAIFMDLLFARLVLDSNVEVVDFEPTELTNNVKEVFRSVSSMTD